MNKIGFISVFYGPQPEYLKLFLLSVKNNHLFDFIIFSDWDDLPVKAKNIISIKLSLNKFNDLAFDKGILEKKIVNPIKLCDLKPAWPHIFEDYYKIYNYDYIGYSDIDIIFGNLNNFINIKILNNVDIWTIHSKYMAGSLTLFKNTRFIKRVYQKSNSFKVIFNSSIHFAFDENFKDEFKNKYINGIRLKSFTEIVNNLEKEGDLNILKLDDVLYESRPNLISYKSNSFFDISGKELLGFHFLIAKKYLLWTFPNWNFIPKKFYINKYGFYKNSTFKLSFIYLLIKIFYLKQVYNKFKNLNIREIIRNNSYLVIITSIRKQFLK